MIRTNDIIEKLRDLKKILISDKKKIGFLFGAGISCANDGKGKIPNVQKMTEDIVNEIKTDDSFKNAIEEIEKEITEKNLNCNIETILSNIEQKLEVIGNGTLNNLKKDGFQKLADLIRNNIRNKISVHNYLDKEDVEQLTQTGFARWVASANRNKGVEIFTTNYDYLLEIGLENFDLPYYDGFTGSYKPFFCSETVENMLFLSNITKIWKIHGSLGIAEDDKSDKIIRSRECKDNLMIYPSSMKYNQSKKQPYATFIDRLNSFLRQDDAVLFVCGYSFGDEHINERIFSALKNGSTSSVFVLDYDENLSPDSAITKYAINNHQMTVYSQKASVNGGVYRTWEINKSVDTDELGEYFEEKDVGDGKTITQLKIVDFKYFVKFLNDMVIFSEEE